MVLREPVVLRELLLAVLELGAAGLPAVRGVVPLGAVLMVLGAPLRRGDSDGGTGAAAALDTNPLTSSSLAAATVAASVPLPGRRPAGGDARAPRFTSMLRSRSWSRSDLPGARSEGEVVVVGRGSLTEIAPSSDAAASPSAGETGVVGIVAMEEIVPEWLPRTRFDDIVC